MKVLILSITLGQGHNACANAIKKTFESMNFKTKVVDMYGHINSYLPNLLNNTYEKSVKATRTKYTRFLGKAVYKSMEMQQNQKKEQSNKTLMQKLLCKEMMALIDSYNPDIIVATQVNCAHTLNELKKDNLIKQPLIGIITDYCVQSHWRHTKFFDNIIVANESLVYPLLKLGIEKKKIIPMGIPIDLKFSKHFDKELAREALGIDKNKKTVLIMSSNTVYKNFKKNIIKLDNLKLDFQIIVVCGRNKALFKSLTTLRTKKLIKIYGYTSKIDLMMDASDIVITKPGGLSITESATKGLAMIFFEPIPGIEDLNIEYILNQGGGTMISPNYTLEQAVYNLISNEDLLNKMKSGAKSITKPLPSIQLYNLVKKMNKANLLDEKIKKNG